MEMLINNGIRREKYQEMGIRDAKAVHDKM